MLTLELLGREVSVDSLSCLLEFACGDVSQDSWSVGRLRYGIDWIAECYGVMASKQMRDAGIGSG